jgi:hypothetical protein
MPIATNRLRMLYMKASMRDEQNVYDSIHVLTLDRFIDCVCDSNLQVLIVPGKKATIEQLKQAWRNIYEQYSDSVQDSDQKYAIKLSRDVNLLATKLNLINVIVERLELQHNPEILLELKKLLNLPGKFDPEDTLQYRKDLKMAVSLSKQFFIKLKSKEAELQNLLPVAQIGGVDRAHFDNLIIQLSKYLKFQINRRQMVTSEFVGMITEMRKDFEIQLKNAKNLKV